MNPVLMLVHNNLEGTKRAVESVLSQDIDNIRLIVMDNDSPQEIRSWLLANDIACPHYTPQLGVTRAWNIGLEACFDFFNCEHCLVVNNDVELPIWFYSALLTVRDDIFIPGLVSGVSVNTPVTLSKAPKLSPLSSHPDFSAFLIRRFLWHHLNGFDERMIYYASDCAFHVEAHRKGYNLVNSGYPFYHERSSTMKTASDEERQAIETQAESDRATFRTLYGCIPGEPEKYDSLFAPVIK